MFRLIVRLFALIGFLVVVLLAGGGYLLYRIAGQQATLTDAIVLELDLERPLAEHAPTAPGPELFFGSQTSMRDVLDALERARTDSRVKGVLARLGGDEIGFAQAQELRDAV